MSALAEEPVRQAQERDHELIHIAKGPDWTHSWCGLPRGDRPLKPGAEPGCVVCVELKAAARGRFS